MGLEIYDNPGYIQKMTKALTKTMSPMPDVSGANNDQHLIDIWLHGRGKHTEKAYRRDLERFMSHVGKNLCQVSVDDVHGFMDVLSGAPASIGRTLSAVKSLLSYGHRTGYLPFNVGVAVRIPKRRTRLAERIMSEPDVQRMLALEPSHRNRTLLRLIYATGSRVSEVCALTWADLNKRDIGGQVTIYGKGGYTRAVMVPPDTWKEVEQLRNDSNLDDPVFRSQKGGHLTTAAVWYIVRNAAKRAGIEGNVSPHWLRHAHASHALDRGAPIHLVQQTLGHASVASTGRYTHARPEESSGKYLAV